MFGTCKRSQNDQTGGADQKCNKNGQKCNPGLIPEYTHLFGQALEYPVCYCREPMLGETEEKDNSTPLGVLPPDFGKEGQACRNQQGNECDPGLWCHYTTDGSAIFGRCEEYTRPVFAQHGDTCGYYAKQGQPRTCDYGLYCKTTNLLGCQHGPCTTAVCTEYSWRTGAQPGSAPAPGN